VAILTPVATFVFNHLFLQLGILWNHSHWLIFQGWVVWAIFCLYLYFWNLLDTEAFFSSLLMCLKLQTVTYFPFSFCLVIYCMIEIFHAFSSWGGEAGVREAWFHGTSWGNSAACFSGVIGLCREAARYFTRERILVTRLGSRQPLGPCTCMAALQCVCVMNQPVN
jgi:hypothetical protein